MPLWAVLSINHPEMTMWSRAILKLSDHTVRSAYETLTALMPLIIIFSAIQSAHTLVIIIFPQSFQGVGKVQVQRYAVGRVDTENRSTVYIHISTIVYWVPFPPPWASLIPSLINPRLPCLDMGLACGRGALGVRGLVVGP